MGEPVPLIVDLDNTFLKTDLFFESILAFLKKNPFKFYCLFNWLIIGGLPYLKFRIAEITPLNLQLMPLNAEFYRYLLTQKGIRPIYLFTGATEKYAKQIAEIYPLFDVVIGSSKSVNFTAGKKLIKIEEMGIAEFDYAGDRRADMKIFKQNRHSLIVNPSLYLQFKKHSNNKCSIYDHTPFFRNLFRVLLSHKWIVNLAMFIPAVIYLPNPLFMFSELSVAYFSFGVLATGTGLLQLLLSLETVRQKKTRMVFHPSVSGVIGIGETVCISTILFLSGFFGLTVFSNPYVQITGVIFFAINIVFAKFDIQNRPVLTTAILFNLMTALLTGYIISTGLTEIYPF